MSDKNKAAVRRVIYQFWNEKHSDVIDELFATDAVLYNNGMASATNLAVELFTTT
jgi:hypothetical protein